MVSHELKSLWKMWQKVELVSFDNLVIIFFIIIIFGVFKSSISIT